MNEQIINHLYGGVLPPGVTRRVHKARQIVRKEPVMDAKREALLQPLIDYLKTHPWSTVPKIAADLKKASTKISGLLFRHSTLFEKRGQTGHFEYRLKQ